MEGQLAQLLGLYRSASLEVVEGMMRHPQLEKIADAYASKRVRLYTTKKGVCVSEPTKQSRGVVSGGVAVRWKGVL